MQSTEDSLTMGEIERRLAAAEQRLIAREERLKSHADAIRGRVLALTPRRLLKSNFMRQMGPLLLPLSGGLASWWVVRRLSAKNRRKTRRLAEQSGLDSLQSPRGNWLTLLTFLLPLLPSSLRVSLGSAGTTAAMLNIGMPLLTRLMGGKAATEGVQERPLPTMRELDLSRYAGTWYEIARLPTSFEGECAGQPIARYTLDGDEVKVLNSCGTAQGGERVAEGVVRATPGAESSAKLQVNFLPNWMRWLPVGWADYWVLFVDEDYSVALVGEPTRQHLWILSRTRELNDDDRQALVSLAANRGFPVDKLVYTTLH